MKVACAVMCIALAGWADAQAAVCVTKNKKGVIKKVAIRETCAKKETATAASTLLQQGPHVLDSSGKEVGALVGSDTVLRQIGSQFVTFSVNSKGVVTPASDSQYGFIYQGGQCSGSPFFNNSGDLFLPSTDDDALSIDVGASADGKTGYYIKSGGATKLTGAVAQRYFQSRCVTPPTAPATATCNTGDTALGAASACDAKKVSSDPTAQCSCIECCSTSNVTTLQASPVQTVDLSGVGTPPFRIER